MCGNSVCMQIDIFEKFKEFLREEKFLAEISVGVYIKEIERLFRHSEKDILSFKRYSEFSDLVISVKKKHNLSHRTVYRIASIGKVFWNWAEREGFIENSILRYGHEFRRGKEREPDFFDRTETSDKNIIEKVLYFPEHSLKHRAIIWLLYSTGIRRSELVGLNYPEDVDLKNRFIHVRQEVGKGEKGRYVPFCEETAGILTLYCRSLEKYWPWKSGPLFVSEKGNRLTAHAVYRFYQNLEKRLGIPVKINPHKWRHSIAGYLIGTKQMDVTAASKILGHSSINTTLKYTHYKPTTLKKLYDEAIKTA